MKLYHEFKSVNGGISRDKIEIAESEDLEVLKKEAFRFAKTKMPGIDVTWNLVDASSMVARLRLDDKSELVIRR